LTHEYKYLLILYKKKRWIIELISIFGLCYCLKTSLVIHTMQEHYKRKHAFCVFVKGDIL